MKSLYINLKIFLFDLLFPRQCVGCSTEGSWICQECLKGIDIIKQPFCPECRRVTDIGEFCVSCRSRFFLDGIFICANFEDGVLKELVHQFKYNRLFDMGNVLGKILAGKMHFLAHDLEEKEIDFDFIIPVPLHKKRRVWRGFNQAEVLGRELLHELNISYHEWENMRLMVDILTRKKYTVPQMELDREGRLNNLKNVFTINESYKKILENKSILLIDDITTTSTTLEECARVLKDNGAKSVWGLVLAKGK